MENNKSRIHTGESPYTHNNEPRCHSSASWREWNHNAFDNNNNNNHKYVEQKGERERESENT
jgi:hypothetical protein